MLNLNWEKIHSIILFVTCHSLRNFPLLIHIPSNPFVNFWNPTSYYFLSLSFDTPHPTPTWPTPPHPYMTHPTPTLPMTPVHDPPHPYMTHDTPSWPTPPHPNMTCDTPSWTTYPYITHDTPFMMNVNWRKNSINNFICPLSWLEKLSPTHTHPLKPICEFLKPYELLFSELESIVKCWMWIGKKFTQ